MSADTNPHHGGERAELFAPAPDSLLAAVTVKHVRGVRDRLCKLSEDEQADTADFNAAIDEFRVAVGALHARTMLAIRSDLPRHDNSVRFICRCLMRTLRFWRLSAARSPHLRAAAAWDDLAAYLAKAAQKGDHWRRWGFASFDTFECQLNDARVDFRASCDHYRAGLKALGQFARGVALLVSLLIVLSVLVILVGGKLRTALAPPPPEFPEFTVPTLPARPRPGLATTTSTATSGPTSRQALVLIRPRERATTAPSQADIAAAEASVDAALSHMFTVDWIVDGRTFRVLHKGKVPRIRVAGIETPAADTPAGEAATEALSDLVWRKVVRLDFVDSPPADDGDVRAARVTVGKLDVAAEMIRQGHARRESPPHRSTTQHTIRPARR